MSVGQPLERVDGRAKVTGRARYTTEHALPNVTHAALVTSTIPKGRVTSIDTGAAERDWNRHGCHAATASRHGTSAAPA